MATIEDFQKLDIRVGRIIDVKDFPEAKKPSYKLRIDFGRFGIKRSSAQITHLYSKEDLKGKQIIAVTNFPPKKIAGFNSEVLVLGAITKYNKVVLLKPEREAELGDKIA
ncbi:MAG: tRNA-binding protein [Candidatus Aenigmarchaeota archaeon]|nr:tRNA-binding protein [Candidatus Aenigmarchaeota archaeon]